ncbi:MAG: hypothetical protein KTR27_05045 [Leptolyngbyaceae cyanobacterium MAG.088]|nr:hypothetical protein [Leptolyngbyaceae cyanobacterium MAG.088]
MEKIDLQKSSNDFKKSLDIVISVLQTKDIAALNNVKDFLYSLPNLKQTEQALASAVLYFAQHDRHVFDWIMTHQSSLLPELDLFAFTRNLVRSRLRDSGWVQSRDFRFDLHNILLLSSLIKPHFTDYFSPSELILIKTTLDISFERS